MKFLVDNALSPSVAERLLRIGDVHKNIGFVTNG